MSAENWILKPLLGLIFLAGQSACACFALGNLDQLASVSSELPPALVQALPVVGIALPQQDTPGDRRHHCDHDAAEPATEACEHCDNFLLRATEGVSICRVVCPEFVAVRHRIAVETTGWNAHASWVDHEISNVAAPPPLTLRSLRILIQV